MIDSAKALSKESLTQPTDGLIPTSAKCSVSRIDRYWAPPVYPYLLKGLAIERPNHAWASNVTYISAQKGFLYLVAVMDGATRRALS